MAEVQLKYVDKIYEGDVHAVQDLTIEVADGEFLVLVGPSGCGKTTALRMIAGLESITDGTITISKSRTVQSTAASVARPRTIPVSIKCAG